MIVHLHTLCWNEADMLGFFFRHYDPWVDRYFVYDDGSTDGSLELLESHPRVELRRFERRYADSYVDSSRHAYDEVWKASRGEADWVVNTQVDEHLWHPRHGSDMRPYLRGLTERGVTAVPALGFQMISEDFPQPHEHLAATRTSGAPFAQMNKLNLFRPDDLEETGFGPGRHVAHPTGAVRYPRRDELLLLHYKYVGYERLVRRHAELSTGLRPRDRESGWAFKYDWDETRLRADWDEFARAALDVTRADLGRTHPERWWRTPSRWAAAATSARRLAARASSRCRAAGRPPNGRGRGR